MNKIIEFIKKQVILVVAWVLAVISTIIIKPSAKQILDAIDWRSLSILWVLMAVVQCFAINGMFRKISVKIVGSVKKVWQLVLSLVVMCFMFSMVITNDVALITFVPLTILILETAGLNRIMIVTVVLETLAANLGSMLTPIGNPQNLYLYNLMGCGVGEFVKIMLPYSVVSLILLVLSIVFVKGRKNDVKMAGLANDDSSAEAGVSCSKGKLILFCVLGVLALLTVFNAIPFYITLGIVLAVLIFAERKAIKQIDYILLLTFIGFFIFTGNLSHNQQISSFLSSLVAGKEVVTGALVSQVISNVPCALLLSGFASSLKDLTIGVNLGGLGTLIASMASLISYKLYTQQKDAKTGKYVAVFTLFNAAYLVILFAFYMMLR